MAKFFKVNAGDFHLGTYQAETEQEARDRAAQDAGYKSEADMERRLDQKSDLVATEV